MNSAQLHLVALCLFAGLSIGCSASDNGPFANNTIEEKVAAVSDELTPEETALVALGESEPEADFSNSPVNQETP